MAGVSPSRGVRGSRIAAFALLGLLLAGAPAPARAELLRNAGFDSPFTLSQITCGIPSVSGAGWAAYGQSSNRLPRRATNPLHSGSHSAEVLAPPAPGCAAAAVYQDLGPIPAGRNYVLGLWVHPVVGFNQVSLIFSWRGTVSGTTAIVMQPTHTDWAAWGTFARTGPVRYGAWNHLELAVDADSRTSRLYVDGALAGETGRGTQTPTGPVTVYLGQGGGSSSSTSHVFYDDVSLVLESPTATTLAADPDGGSVAGQPVSFTARVCSTAPAAGAPQGVVEFRADGAGMGSETLVPSGDPTCATASVDTAELAVGEHEIEADYLGTEAFEPSAGSLRHTVSRRQSTLELSSSANPALVLDPVTVTATVCPASPGAGTPTGSVRFRDETRSTDLGELPLAPDDDGCASAATELAAPPVGGRTITADYGGDANGEGASGNLEQCWAVPPAGAEPNAVVCSLVR